MRTAEFNPQYGTSHSKFYKPSVVAPFLVEKDSTGNVICYRSDRYLLLRQQSKANQIGAESIRRYLDGLTDKTHHANSASLTDDELFSLIPPKAVNNLTTATEYLEYLASQEKELKVKSKELQDKHSRLTRYFRDFDDLRKKESDNDSDSD